LKTTKPNFSKPYLTLPCADAPGPITAFYRVVISILLLLPLFLRRVDRKSLTRKLLIIPLWGGIFTALDFAFWNTSIGYTTAGNATLLGNTAPLWVALGAWLIFRETLRRDFWIGLLLALSGATLIIGADFLTSLHLGIGDVLAIIAGVFYGAYFLVTQNGRKHFNPLPYVWLVSISAAIGLALINIGLEHRFVGYSRETWLAFIGAGIVSQTIGYLSVSYAMGHLPAAVVAPTMIGQPIITTLIAIPLLGEIPAPAQILGGAVALTGIFLINRSHRKNKML
jgi:drug/metabolite transporter (DMT)-like permease